MKKLPFEKALYILNEIIERESTIYYKWKLIHTKVLDEWNEENYYIWKHWKHRMKLKNMKALIKPNETIEYECNKKREWKLLRKKVLLIMNEIINMESIKNQEWKVLNKNEQS